MSRSQSWQEVGSGWYVAGGTDLALWSGRGEWGFGGRVAGSGAVWCDRGSARRNWAEAALPPCGLCDIRQATSLGVGVQIR